MTTIARQANLRIADRTAPLAQLVIDAKFAAIVEHYDAIDAEADLHTCELRGCRTPELFTRIDNRDMATVKICETCADTADVSYIAE